MTTKELAEKLADIQTALEENFPGMNMKQIEEFCSFHYEETSVFESIRRCIEDNI